MSRTREHGTHNTYSGGCRCQPCRTAHAAYVRAGRTAAAARRRATEGPYVAAGITHGYNGYQNHGCRCEVCRENRADYDRGRNRRPARRERQHQLTAARRPTRYGRARCPVCDRDVAILASGHLRSHGKVCDGSWTRANQAAA